VDVDVLDVQERVEEESEVDVTERVLLEKVLLKVVPVEKVLLNDVPVDRVLLEKVTLKVVPVDTVLLRVVPVDTVLLEKVTLKVDLDESVDEVQVRDSVFVDVPVVEVRVVVRPTPPPHQQHASPGV
jgi:hypothetical protein